MIFRLLSIIGAAKKVSEQPIVAGAVAGVGDLFGSLVQTASDTRDSAVKHWGGAAPGAIPPQASQAAQQAAPYAQQAAQAAQPITDPFVKAAAPSLAPAVGDDLISRAKQNWPVFAGVGAGLGLLGIALRKGR